MASSHRPKFLFSVGVKGVAPVDADDLFCFGFTIQEAPLHRRVVGVAVQVSTTGLKLLAPESRVLRCCGVVIAAFDCCGFCHKEVILSMFNF